MQNVRINNELEAVQLSKTIWEFLKNTGYDKFAYNEEIHNMYLAGCPLCQFHIAQNKKLNTTIDGMPGGCTDCSLKSRHLCHFSYNDSAFNIWDNTYNPNVKKTHAEIIYNALVKREAELLDEQIKTEDKDGY